MRRGIADADGGHRFDRPGPLICHACRAHIFRAPPDSREHRARSPRTHRAARPLTRSHSHSPFGGRTVFRKSGTPVVCRTTPSKRLSDRISSVFFLTLRTAFEPTSYRLVLFRSATQYANHETFFTSCLLFEFSVAIIARQCHYSMSH